MGGGVVGLLAQPFFVYNGKDYIILTDDGYKLFGFNFVGLLAIMVCQGQGLQPLTRISTFSSSFYTRDGDNVDDEKRSRIYIFLIS